MKIAKFSNNVAAEYNRRTGMVNIGDSIISLAFDNMFDMVGVTKSEVMELPIYGNHNTEEECILPICGHFGRQYDMDFLNNSKIHPIFIGFGIKDEFLTEKETAYIKKYEPILCRDAYTCDVLRSHNIESYIFGCLTLLFPERMDNDQRNIFFVDIKDDYKQFIPNDILKNAIFLSQNISYNAINDKGEGDVERYAKQRLRRYAQEAKLIVTSKLHCMCPCVAMGIPTIALGDNFSFRYSFIDAFINSYNKDNIYKLNWDSISIDNTIINKVKIMMAEIVISIFNKNPNMKKIQQLHDFYKQRMKWEYFHEIGKTVDNFFSQDAGNEYVIWGASSGGYAVYSCIKRRINANLVGVIDSYATGLFAGLSIDRPAEITNKFKKAKVVVSTLSGRDDAIGFLNNIGKRENIDYIFLHESS